MGRVKHQISFRQEDKRHLKAEAYLLTHKNRSEYVVNCILKAEEQDAMLTAMREIVQSCFTTTVTQVATVPPTPASVPKQIDCPLSKGDELSAELLQFMEEL